jgi:hypothetical protein
LTVVESLMYHPQVREFVFLAQLLGRLLKLVDRADLGSVGASRESSSLSSPISQLPPGGRTLVNILLTSGSGSVVEHLLAKEKVAGSIPVSRSILSRQSAAASGGAEWVSADATRKI